LDDIGFELLASSLRADIGDLRVFTEVLAAKLEEALPEQTTIERRGGLFAKKKAVRHITVELDENRFELEAENGRVQPRRCRVVRGIVLKTEPVPLDEWIDDLSRELAHAAQRNERARIALQRLLEG
jgi:hypothetical protein